MRFGNKAVFLGLFALSGALLGSIVRAQCTTCVATANTAATGNNTCLGGAPFGLALAVTPTNAVCNGQPPPACAPLSTCQFQQFVSYTNGCVVPLQMTRVSCNVNLSTLVIPGGTSNSFTVTAIPICGTSCGSTFTMIEPGGAQAQVSTALTCANCS